MGRLSLIIAVLFSVAGVASPIQAANFTCGRLDQIIAKSMEGWQVPGLAIGIVREGETAARRTYGFSNVDEKTPVTEKTLFGIGSIAKSMTALGFAISDAKGERPLDFPVNSVLPYFPPDITIRHLLSHTAGWPRHDALWYLNAFNRHTLTEKLSRLPRFAAPGQAFQYNNVPFAAVGTLLNKSGNVSWDAWIRAVILDPAGMTSAVTRFPVFRDSKARATPYFPADEGRIRIPLRDTDPVAPAAGIYVPLPDMIRYLRLLAGDGEIDGTRVFPAAAIRKIRTPVAGGYGLGLRLGTWRGEELAFHPGFIDGYGARLSVLPGRNSGVVVLTNMSGETPVARIVSQTALDCLADGPETDWVARFGHRRPPPKARPALPAPTPPDRPLKAYAGRYAHPAYGDFVFAPGVIPGLLAGTFHGRNVELAYAGEDRWRLTDTHWPLREGLIFSFTGFGGEGFAQLAVPLADGPVYRHNAGPLIFSRRPLFSGAAGPN